MQNNKHISLHPETRSKEILHQPYPKTIPEYSEGDLRRIALIEERIETIKQLGGLTSKIIQFVATEDTLADEAPKTKIIGETAGWLLRGVVRGHSEETDSIIPDDLLLTKDGEILHKFNRAKKPGKGWVAAHESIDPALFANEGTKIAGKYLAYTWAFMNAMDDIIYNENKEKRETSPTPTA